MCTHGLQTNYSGVFFGIAALLLWRYVLYTLILQHMILYEGNFLEFIRSPISQDVPPGTNAEFTCQHSTADIIRWTVNGSLIGQNTSPDIRTASGDGVNILTITARPQYNGTVVKCVAKFDNGRQDELSAVATLQGIIPFYQHADSVSLKE